MKLFKIHNNLEKEKKLGKKLLDLMKINLTKLIFYRVKDPSNCIN